MRRAKSLALVLAWLAAACATLDARAQQGTLVIVGGGLDPANEEVFSAFLNARPADIPLIAIIPAASGEPSRSAEDFRQALAAHGIDTNRIEVVRLATEDDPTTPAIDEALWAANVSSAEEIARIGRAGAIWFTGGDQSRITRLLLDAEGGDTPMLSAIRERLAGGAVVGGTSAGAAIMSNPMITQGDTLATLLPDNPGEPLRTGAGLGFAAGMLVDQHFGERARLGRLAAALVQEGQPHRKGVGIDENTALVLRIGDNEGRVVGEGYVTFLDAIAVVTDGSDRFAATNFNLSLAASGDTIDLASGSVSPAEFKQQTLGNEYFDSSPIAGGGMAFGATSLAEVVGEGLLDNSAAQSIERQSFSNSYGVTYRFTQTDKSKGWWGRGPDGSARYAFENVRFDIEPIDVIIRRVEN